MKLHSFAEKHPALLFGISATFGSLLYFEQALWPAAAWICTLFFLSRKRAVLQTTCLLFFALYCHTLFSLPPLSGVGRGVFAIHSVQRTRSPFSSGWLYQGELRAFESKAGRWPCTVIYKGKGSLRPKANCNYLLEGELCQRGPFNFTLKTKEWKPIEGTFSLAEIRMKAKEKIRSLLQRHMQIRSANFLTALFTGNLEDRMLRFEFGRLGLQHILAISGFHFALLAAFAAYFLRYLFPYRPRLIALLGLATLYFILIGNSPPVLRSFLAAALFLFGRFLGRRSSGLNLLGACLLFEIAIDPLCVTQLGFQLSFLSCAAILLLTSPIRLALSPLFPKRTLKEAASLPFFSQFVTVCISFFVSALSLTLAVNLALFPLLLHQFHRFPLLSLLYNLFIPPLSALCLLLTLPALVLAPLFPLFAFPFFKMAGFMAGELLEIVGHPPAFLDAVISMALPGWVLAPWLFILFILGIYFHEGDLQFFPFSSKKDVHFHGGRSSVG